MKNTPQGQQIVKDNGKVKLNSDLESINFYDQKLQKTSMVNKKRVGATPLNTEAAKIIVQSGSKNSLIKSRAPSYVNLKTLREEAKEQQM